MNKQKFYMKKNGTDRDMIEFYTKLGSHTILAGVVHEDCISEIVTNYGDNEDYLSDGVVAYLMLEPTETF